MQQHSKIHPRHSLTDKQESHDHKWNRYLFTRRDSLFTTKDDMGTEHIFILDNCLYHPKSLVNPLSTSHLAEKFINKNGNPHKET
jgi:hypothetical protein